MDIFYFEALWYGLLSKSLTIITGYRFTDWTNGHWLFQSGCIPFLLPVSYFFNSGFFWYHFWLAVLWYLSSIIVFSMPHLNLLGSFLTYISSAMLAHQEDQNFTCSIFPIKRFLVSSPSSSSQKTFLPFFIPVIIIIIILAILFPNDLLFSSSFLS